MPSCALFHNTTLSPLRHRDKKKEKANARIASGSLITDKKPSPSRTTVNNESTANAPICGSFSISRFFSILWYECRASQVSRKPSTWNPPVTSKGIAAITQSDRNDVCHGQLIWYHTTSRTPINAPIHGKKQRWYFISSDFQTNRGIGILEYIEKATAIDLNHILNCFIFSAYSLPFTFCLLLSYFLSSAFQQTACPAITS